MESTHHGTTYLKKIFDTKLSGAIHIVGDLEDIAPFIDSGAYDVVANLDGKKIRVSEFKYHIARTQITSEKKKLFIISNAESMSSEIYNSFLKILEEPVGTFFILISRSEIPSTIKSRVIEISFKKNRSIDVKNFFDLDMEGKISFLDSDESISLILDFLLEKHMDNITFVKTILNMRKYRYEKINIAPMLLIFLKFIKKH